MMNNREKQKLVFTELVNKQLEPFNITHADVNNDPDWYMHYRTTKEQEESFIKWGTDLIRKKLKLTKAMATQEMSWFILQWGLTTNQSDLVKKDDISTVEKKYIKKTGDKS